MELVLVNKYKCLSIQAKASLWFILCNILQKGIGFISTPLYTRIMDVESFGKYSVFLSWSSIIGLFVTINAAGGVINNGLTKYNKDQDKFISSLQGITSFSLLLFYVLYITFYGVISKYIPLSKWLVTMMFLDLFFSTSLSNWLATQRYNYEYIKMVLVIVLKTIINVILAYIFIINSNNKVEARILSDVICSISFGIYIYILNIAKGRTLFKKEYWKFILYFNIPLIPHVLSTLILNQTDRLMIERFCGTDKAGIYSLAYTVGMAISVITGSINSSMVPWLYKSMEHRKYKDIKENTKILISAVGIFILCFVIVGPELLSIMGSIEYQEAKYILPPLAVSLFFIFIYTIFINIEMYLEKTSLIMSASISVAIINIVMNFLLINKFGYQAAAYSTLICYILFCIVHFIFMKKSIKIVLTDTNIKIIDVPFIILVSVIIIISMLVILLIYPYNWIRYTLMLFIIVISIIKRKKILNILKLIKNRYM